MRRSILSLDVTIEDISAMYAAVVAPWRRRVNRHIADPVVLIGKYQVEYVPRAWEGSFGDPLGKSERVESVEESCVSGNCFPEQVFCRFPFQRREVEISQENCFLA